MTDGFYVPLCTAGFRRSAGRSSRGDTQSFRGCGVDRVSGSESRVGSVLCVSPSAAFSRSHLSLLLSTTLSRHTKTMENVFGVIVLLAMIQLAMCNSNNSYISPSPSKFFPKINGNLTKIVWAHAVNSQAELDKALASEDVMMLEADVVLGRLIINSTNNQEIPIMAHPPANESDLSLEQFLKAVTNTNSSKGIKLDFKSAEAFNTSTAILAQYRSELKFPVFLNADILPGPVNAITTPVNAQSFLRGANKTLPESTLSVGWTTRYGKEFNITSGQYTSEQIQKMLDVLAENKVTQSVTYPVRAGLVANDIESVKKLLKNTTFSTTLTIWSSEGDSVDAVQLSNLIKQVGTDKVYLDVPEELKNKLDFSTASTVAANLSASLVFILILLMLL